MNEQQQGYVKKEFTTNQKIIKLVELAIENNDAEQLFRISNLFEKMGQVAMKLDEIFNSPTKP